MTVINPFKDKHILIIIENLPAPLDRRVWQEALTLTEQGAKVSIICPKMKGFNKSFEVIDSIEIYRHFLPIEGTGVLGYFLEYASALFFEFFLALRIFIKNRFHVIQGCNPPDLIFLVAIPFKLFGVKFVFDHHDLNPELFKLKFGSKHLLYKSVTLLERLTFAASNYSIATNQSFKNIAMTRGKMSPNRVRIVRSGPDLNNFLISEGNSVYKKGRKYLVGYVGVIAEQDGLDVLMRMIRAVVNLRDDVQFAIMGDGTSLQSVKELAKKLEISEYVDFYGMITERKLLLSILNTCDIGVNPDLPNGFNDVITSNKVIEYMALKIPVVQFDLKEGKYSAAQASLYANSENDFVGHIISLLDDQPLRESMGEQGYTRVVNELSWQNQKMELIGLYEDLFEEGKF